MAERIVVGANWRKYITTETEVHPPRREWIGLTIGELSALYSKHAKYQQEGMLLSGWLDFAAEHDALLKEKNS